MGYLGFYFEILDEKLVVIVENEKLVGNYVVGTASKFDYKQCQFQLLDKLEFRNFPTFEDSKFKYAKISLSEKTIVDFEHLTMWFSATKYRKLRQLFHFDEKVGRDELKKRVVEIYDFFLPNSNKAF